MAFLQCTCGSMLKGIQFSRLVSTNGEFRIVKYESGFGMSLEEWSQLDASTQWLNNLNEGVYCISCNGPINLDQAESDTLLDKRIPGVYAKEFNSSHIVEQLEKLKEKERSEIFVQKIPARSSRYGQIEGNLPVELSEALNRMNISSLYTHQAETYNAVRKQNDVVLVTQTASGKTLSYNLPVLHGLIENSNAKALYLFPTKALADDQVEQLYRWTEEHGTESDSEIDSWFERFITLGNNKIHYGRYDGDTQLSSRNRLIKDGRILFTNPDMIHHSLLKHFADRGRQYAHIKEFLENLKFIVIDEMHLYRGAFGTHVSMVLRRLRKVCEELGNNNIRFILCSATIDRPDLVAKDLTGLNNFKVIDNDGSMQKERSVVFWNPGETLGTGQRKAPLTDALAITEDILVQDKKVIRSIVFQGSRLQGKVTAKYMKDILRKVLKLPRERVNGLKLTGFYNGMLSVEERKAVIDSIKKNEVHVVLATNALEVGIDIGELSFALLIGYPGSKAAFSQQIGRVGRNGEGVSVMIVEDEPLQQYYMNNPELFLEKPPEVVRIDPRNKQLLLLHLSYLEKELSRTLTTEDVFWFVEDEEYARKLKQQIICEDESSDRCNLRSGSSVLYKVLSTRNREVLFEGIDEWTAFRDFHKDAIHWNANEKAYRVDAINKNSLQILLTPLNGEIEYYTQSIFKDTIDINESEKVLEIQDLLVFTGILDIRRNVFSYQKTYFASRQQEKVNLESPLSTIFQSEGMWISIPSIITDKLKTDYEDKLDGAIRAAEHVLLSIIPDSIICDGKDVSSFSGVSLANFNNRPIIGFYGDQSGGMGTTLAIAEHLQRIIKNGLLLLQKCSCKGGCPSCIQYPGKDNDNLSKAGAQLVLQSLLEVAWPKPEEEIICR
ncbi:DEAD/DEAH box helicase [Fictibacillus aquaticus]|uniref:DEAD/DEAH box helicase n=1 Tax=Fictibacillus aquaticus TaxID=2021314 RepID=A0A235FF28_9BACL|nr:DEAD/DEAH box helicase [Fictibacillus aquaticus]OYD59375.1 hypothetical protein CGZ90_05660 [Fictibacillus aquaticus]